MVAQVELAVKVALYSIYSDNTTVASSPKASILCIALSIILESHSRDGLDADIVGTTVTV